MRMEK